MAESVISLLGAFRRIRFSLPCTTTRDCRYSEKVEAAIPGNKDRIVALKSRLKDHWSKGYLPEDDERSVIADVKKIIGYKRGETGDPGPERTLPIAGEDIDVRTYIGMMKYNSYMIANALKSGVGPDKLNEAARESAAKGLAPKRSN